MMLMVVVVVASILPMDFISFSYLQRNAAAHTTVLLFFSVLV